MSTKESLTISDPKAKLEKLAPFRDTDRLSPREQLLLAFKLGEYLEDPYTARNLEKQWYGVDDGLSDAWNPGYENRMGSAARDSLDHMAQNGQTFLVQELARGFARSPLARVFDRRPGNQFDLATPEETESVSRLDKEVVADTPALAALQNFLKRTGVLPNRMQRGERVFAEAEQDFVSRGYLEKGALERDNLFQSSKQRGNFVAMQNRMWSMAYEMPAEAKAQQVLPYDFEMRAVGSVTYGEVSEEFFDKFIKQSPVEYKEIIDAGLSYTVVQSSTDTFGFFESNKLVKLFHTTEGLRSGDQAKEFAIEARIAELFTEADEDELFETAQAYHLLAGNLQTRNILEEALDVRFDTLTVDDQILLGKLLMHATPGQMKGIGSQGSDVLKNVARTLEFGKDYGNAIRFIAEHAPTKEASKIFETVNAFREHSAKFAGLFDDFDPALAKATEQAMNERLTDSLYSVEKMANEGSLEVDVAPHRSSPDYKNDGRFMAKEDSIEDGIYLLEHTKKTPELVANILTAPDVVVSKAAEGAVGSFAMYRLVSETHGQALVYLREYGAEKYDRDFEYGNRDGVEASASFMVDPADPHRHLSVGKDPNAVSLRFDRQGFAVDEAHSIEERSPIREKGSISLDISSGMGNPKSLPVRIGRFIAAGNLLRAKEVGSAESLHHNMNGFDQEKYGSVEGFAEIPRYIKRTLEAMIAAQRDRKLGSLASRRQNTASDYSEAA